MLYLEFGKLCDFMKRKDFILRPGIVFDADVDVTWLEDPLVRTIISDVDHIKLCGPTLTSLFQQGMSYTDLSNGTKNLILCKYYDSLNHLSKMGENCWKYLMDIANTQNVRMAVTSACFFPDDVLQHRNVCFTNHNVLVNTQKDFFTQMVRLEEEFQHGF